MQICIKLVLINPYIKQNCAPSWTYLQEPRKSRSIYSGLTMAPTWAGWFHPTVTYCFNKIWRNIVLPPTPRFSKWLFHSGLVSGSLCAHLIAAMPATCPKHPPLFDHSKSYWVHVTDLGKKLISKRCMTFKKWRLNETQMLSAGLQTSPSAYTVCNFMGIVVNETERRSRPLNI